jgi:hypothetical protein
MSAPHLGGTPREANMIRSIGRSAAVISLSATAVLGNMGAAAADPANAPNSIEVALICDNGATYTAVANGGGQFAAAHDVESNATLIPTAFGPFHGMLTDEDGNVLEEFTDPAVAKGSSTKARATSISCTFVIEETFTDPNLGLLTFHGEGSVVGFSTPVR